MAWIRPICIHIYYMTEQRFSAVVSKLWVIKWVLRTNTASKRQLSFNPKHISIIISTLACVHSIHKDHYVPQMIQLTQSILKKIQFVLHLLPAYFLVCFLSLPIHQVQLNFKCRCLRIAQLKSCRNSTISYFEEVLLTADSSHLQHSQFYIRGQSDFSKHQANNPASFYPSGWKLNERTPHFNSRYTGHVLTWPSTEVTNCSPGVSLYTEF